jgi:hypothetical protein
VTIQGIGDRGLGIGDKEDKEDKGVGSRGVGSRGDKEDKGENKHQSPIPDPRSL